MRSSLIATGGALLAAAALFGSAGAAAADTWTDWNHRYPDHCGLGVNEDTTYHLVTRYGIFAGTRAAGCKDSHPWWGGNWGWDGHHGKGVWGEDHWTHRNWPASGNGNWAGHGFGPGTGIGVD
ncbi:hypothetical protein ACFLIM_07780 [Nonomuraea sp. M3C6]|uniref:Uncharacterized protein n=1 Tax=Nonomuraea marmarensis TaxID=3351344 RepID=A0ABW7A6V5_9ACTN